MKDIQHRDRVVVPVVEGEGDTMTIKLGKGQVYGTPSDGLVGVTFGKDTPVKMFSENEVYVLYRPEYSEEDGHMLCARLIGFMDSPYGV